MIMIDRAEAADRDDVARLLERAKLPAEGLRASALERAGYEVDPKRRSLDVVSGFSRSAKSDWPTVRLKADTTVCLKADTTYRLLGKPLPAITQD